MAKTKSARGMVSPTATRVQENTTPQVREQIHRQTEARFLTVAAQKDPEAIERRLRELDQEWDIERVLQTNFGIVTLASITLGALISRKWYLLGGVAAGFMVEHALEGWCPPVPIFRRLGYRTMREIDQERYALKALRGDFDQVERDQPAKVLQAAMG
jgi:hypothetical protein